MKEFCTVTNKSAGRVGYTIPEIPVRRMFYPHESIPEVPVAELKRLVQQPGGKNLFYHFLYVEDKEIAEYLIGGKPDPEYWLTEDQIPSWMSTCSLPEFQDALDFAPQGTKDLIKKYAIELELNDYTKRQAIKEQLKFDVTMAIENNKEEQLIEEKATARRVEIKEETPRRRVEINR